MKIEFADYVWAVLSVIIVGASYMNGRLILGVITVYVLMAVLFFVHIMRLRKKMDGSVTVYGTITDYHEEHERYKLYYPVVNYVTEEGREISTVYMLGSRKMNYSIGSEERICYSPDDPMFFYFAEKEDELANKYYKYILITGIITAVICLCLYYL